jgi:hypothetical protein
MTATQTALPLVVRSHSDELFAVVVTDRLSDGSLGVLVQDSLGRQQMAVRLTEADLVRMLDLVRESR